MSNSTVNKLEDNWPYKIQLWRKEFCPKTFGGGLIKRKETYFSFLFAKKHTYLGRFCYKVGDSFLLFRKLLSFMQLVSEGHPPLKKKHCWVILIPKLYVSYLCSSADGKVNGKTKAPSGTFPCVFPLYLLVWERSHLWRDISIIVSFGYLLFESLRLSFHTHQWYNLSDARKCQIGCFQSFLGLAPGNKGKRQRVTLSFSLLPLGL